MRDKEEKRKNVYEECPNDRINGLKGKISIKEGKKTVKFIYDGRFGQGYDGCGTHTHQF